MSFKVPATRPRKRIKEKTVLEEEVYLDEMGKIIERDFFPDLKKMKAQNEFLDAIADKDDAKLRSLYSRYSGSRPPTLPYASPATFETPERSVQDTSREEPNIEESHLPKIPKISLDQFVEHCTSEDNVNFAQLILKSQKKHEERYHWMFKDEEALSDKSKILKVPSIEEQANGEDRPLALDTWSYTNNNPLMFHPKGAELTEREVQERLCKKQTIVHSNTSLHETPFNEQRSKSQIEEMALTQTKARVGKIGLDGKTLTFQEKSPERQYFGTPSPRPGVNESPLMTWGEIEGTPFRLDGGDTPRHCPGPSFHIQQVPKRERIAYALADKITDRHRSRRPTPRPTPSPRSGRGMLEAMSPAARRLASSTISKRPDSRPLTPQSLTPLIRPR